MSFVAKFLAKRYFSSITRRTFVHRLSLLSMGMVLVGAMALVVGVSAFNGMEAFIRDVVCRAEADILLRRRDQQRFVYSDSLQQQLKQTPNVRAFGPVLADYALVRYETQQSIAKIKGVDVLVLEKTGWQDYVYPYDLSWASLQQTPYKALLGGGMQQTLQMPLQSEETPILQLIYPTEKVSFDLRKLYSTASVTGAGIFVLQSELDDEMIIVPWQVTQQLFGATQQCNSIDIYLHEGADIDATIAAIGIGTPYELLRPEVLHQSLYRLLRIEKFFVFLAFGFILAVAFLGLFFSHTMLYLNKQSDLRLLHALGAPVSTGAKVLLYHSAYTVGIGGSIGIGIGLGLCWLQDSFGFITLSQQGRYALPYPVVVRAADVLRIIGIMVLLTGIALVQPAVMAVRKARGANASPT